MHDFRYVPKSEYQPLKTDVIELLKEVQDSAITSTFSLRFYWQYKA